MPASPPRQFRIEFSPTSHPRPLFARSPLLSRAMIACLLFPLHLRLPVLAQLKLQIAFDTFRRVFERPTDRFDYSMRHRPSFAPGPIDRPFCPNERLRAPPLHGQYVQLDELGTHQSSFS